MQLLPREARTSQVILGDTARWGDGEYLMAMAVDSLAHLGWMFAGVHAKNPPKKPPQPVRRPGDISKIDGVTATLNVAEKTQIMAGSLTLAELDAAVERQTGARRGIAVEV